MSQIDSKCFSLATPAHSPRTAPVVQLLAGFATWMTAVSMEMTVARHFRGGSASFDALSLSILLMVLALAAFTHLKLGWRSYWAGLILGIGITLLLPLGLVADVCGPFHQ